MANLHSINIFPADGVRTDWDFQFSGVNLDSQSGTTPYLYPTDVKCQELYTDELGAQQLIDRAGVLIAPTTFRITGAPVAIGRQVKIYRQTEILYPLVDYRDRQVVSEFDLDLANRQAIFIAQETQDIANTSIVLDPAGNFDVNGRRIVNLVAGIDEGDAVNVGQLNRTIRVPATDAAIPPLAGAAARANRLLSFDDAGNPVATLPQAGSATQLALDLAAKNDPTRGTALVGYEGGTLFDYLGGLVRSANLLSSAPDMGGSLVGLLNGNKLNTLLNPDDPALGAAQLGYRRDINTLPGYLGDKLRLTSVDVLEVIPKSQWAAILAGTSVYDATTAVQALIDAKALTNESIRFDVGRLMVSHLELKNGLRGFFGKGTVKTNDASTAAALGVIIAKGSFYGPFVGVDNCYLGGLTIDSGGGSKRGLFLSSFTNFVIDGLTVQGQDLVSSNSGIRLNFDCTDGAIANCRVKLPTVTNSNTESAYGIHIVSNDASYSGWGTGNIIPATNQCLRIQILDNHVSGGTHSISLTGTDRCIVAGNYLEYAAHRNIHVTHSRFNLIHGNYCLEAGSSAIIMGYGADGNHVIGNYCYSNQPGGEGSIECYVATRDCTIMFNRIRTGANYGIYLAIDCTTCVVSFNSIDMTVTQLAGIAVESEWSGTPSALFPYSRPNYGAPPGTRVTWANGATSALFIHHNNIFAAPAGKCGIYVAQRAQAPVIALSIVGNVVDDASLAHSYYFTEGTASQLVQCVFQNNSTSTQNRNKVFATRGRAHFNSVMGNDTLNGDGWWRPPTTGGQPSVFQTDKLDLTVHASNVNYFSGGKDGQTITVRVHTGMTLVYAAGTLWLKGTTNAICQDNQIFVFENIGGVWFEVSRNF